MDNLGYVPEENGRVFAISRYAATNPNDYLVEVNSRSKIFKKPAFYKRLSLLLCIVATVFLIALIILLILYCRSKSSICTTDECLRSATNFKYSMDLSVDPCDDFYEFTCGKWTEEHPNHGWYPSFSTFQTIDEKINIRMTNFFKSDSVDEEPEAVTKMRDLYESCMDQDSINNLGLSVMYKYLQIGGLPIVPNFFNTTEDFKFNWLKTETQVKKMIDASIFFGFAVGPNLHNISQNVIVMGTAEGESPLPSPFQNREINKKLEVFNRSTDDDDEDDEEKQTSEEFKAWVKATRAKIVKFIVKGVMKNNSMEEPKEEILDLAGALINNITTFLQDNIKNYSASRNNYITHSKTIVEAEKDLNDALMNFTSKTYPNFYSTYTQYIFEGTNIVVDPKKDQIYFYDREEQFIPVVLGYLLELTDSQIELYLWWVTVYSLIMSTTSEFSEPIATEVAPYYAESDVIRSRSLECTMLATSYMGMAASYVLADPSFKNSTTPKVERMINEIKAAFVEQVNSIKWMDQETKKVTLEKVNETLTFIGYPDWLFNNGSLDEKYKNVEVNATTFLDNLMSFVNADVQENLSKYTETNKRNWSTEPIAVNAFNSFFDNAINIPMAILMYPMYNLGLEYLNYGAIGSILGHELTHGFDNSGRKHDKYGNYIQWWSNKTIDTFENKTQCFVDQYNNFTIEDIKSHVDGKKTLGENIADNGGVHQALKAYQKYVQLYGEEKKLPGFESYSNDQMFFIAYGSIWCETVSTDDIENQMETDEHAPNSVRVIGTLQNSDDFSKAFNCPKGSNMNPERRKCKIW